MLRPEVQQVNYKFAICEAPRARQAAATLPRAIALPTWQATKLATSPTATPHASRNALPNSSGATRPETSANDIIWMNASIDDARPRLSGNRASALTWIAGIATHTSVHRPAMTSCLRRSP